MDDVQLILKFNLLLLFKLELTQFANLEFCDSFTARFRAIVTKNPQSTWSTLRARQLLCLEMQAGFLSGWSLASCIPHCTADLGENQKLLLTKFTEDTSNEND